MMSHNLSDDSDEDGHVHKKFKRGHAPRGTGLGKQSLSGSLSSDSEDEGHFPNKFKSQHGLAVGQSASKPESAAVAQGFIKTKPEKAPQYSTVAEKLMARMGYKEGTGLGRHGQGRVAIVEASSQKGRRGLGMSIRGFEPADIEWNFDKEEVSAEESVDWIPTCQQPVPEFEEMMDWIGIGKKKLSIDDETKFCSPQLLLDVLNCKTVFDNLEGEEMRRARTRSNPYETIRGAFFLNRAAMKMANMDAILNFMFTNPLDNSGRSVVGPSELLYFADICAGPGGFSEYVLWRKGWDAKGFGFTLKGPCDFKLEDFFAAPAELFEPHYGVGGLQGDGDIYRYDNQQEFRKFVKDNTDGKGLHFVMADGGFSVEGQENIQEILSKRLYLCQFLVALSVLRPGGHFVCKLFDLFTSFSVGLVYLMYRAFNRVSIFKPVTSRPANSERYIVCQGMREDSGPIHDYMFEVNRMMDKYHGVTSQEDIMELVPHDVMEDDKEFFEYILDSNEKLAVKQAISLAKIRAFAQNTDLYETRQSSIREECLKIWKIPDKVRTAPSRPEPVQEFKSLLQGGDQSAFNNRPEPLTHENLENIHSVYDYRCYVTAGEHFFIMGLGRSYVSWWNGLPNSRWTKQDINVELPKGTLIEAEIVTELRGEGKAQRRVKSVHVIDAMVLCGKDIRDLHYNERMEKLKKFLKAIHRPTKSDVAPIRVKDIHRFEDIKKLFSRLDMKVVKGSGGTPRLCYCTEQKQYFLPTGVQLIKTVRDPWMMALSRSQQKKYFYHTNTKQSVFHTPEDSISSYLDCLKGRYHWKWEEGVRVHDAQSNINNAKLSRESLLDFIHKKTH